MLVMCTAAAYRNPVHTLWCPRTSDPCSRCPLMAL